MFYKKIISDDKLIFFYEEVFVGAIAFNRTGLIFKKYDPTDELYIAYLAVLKEIEEDTMKMQESRKSEALKEIEQTYSR